MGLFNCFKKKSPIKDIVWMNHAAKMKGVSQYVHNNKNVVLIAWFEDTFNEFHSFIHERHGMTKVPLFMARNVTSFAVHDKRVVFVEHYPLCEKENTLIQNWKAEEIVVMSALDDPLFLQFGGEKISALMEKMGLKETEPVEHTLISKSIANAQRKLGRKLRVEHAARSMKEWFHKNISA